MPSSGGCEDKFTELCGDPDVFFAYTATKQVMIKDRRLGLLNYCFMLLIAFYIFVIQLLLGQGYLHMWDADNTVRLSLKEPVVDGCNPLEDTCASNFNLLSNPGTNPWTNETGKQYCCDDSCKFNKSWGDTSCECPGRDLQSNNCTYVDGLGAMTVNGRSIAVTTRRKIWSQVRNTTCFLDGGVSGASTCGGVWNTKIMGSTYFVKDIEDFVLEIDHTLSWETDDFSRLIPATGITEAYIEIGIGSEATDETRNSGVCNMLGQQNKAVVAGTFGYVPATKAPCLVRITDIQGMLLNSTSLLDELPVWVALLASGLELEDVFLVQGVNHSHRFAGAVVSITIDYSNLNPKPWWGLTTISPFYIYRFKAMKGSTFTMTEMQESFNRSSRTVQDTGAISFEVHAGGSLATFSMSYMMIQLTTSLALTALATVIVSYLAQYALRHSHFYNKALVEETTDFSNVDVLLELKTEDQIWDMLEEGKITTYGLNFKELKRKLLETKDEEELEKVKEEMDELKKNMILRLVNAGWTASKEEEAEAYRKIDERHHRRSTSCFGLCGSKETDEERPAPRNPRKQARPLAVEARRSGEPPRRM